jgi:hypothetical protein
LAGSLRAGVESYYRSDDFKTLDLRTQRLRRNLLDRLCERTNKRGEPYADQPLRALDAHKIGQWRDESAPETGNAIVKTLRQVFKAAIAERESCRTTPRAMSRIARQAPKGIERGRLMKSGSLRRGIPSGPRRGSRLPCSCTWGNAAATPRSSASNTFACPTK